MTTYISILRGINVSGHNIIKMDQLKQLMMNLGFENVQTYIQSGNIIYQTKQKDTTKLSESIIKTIQKDFGYDVPVITLSINILEKIIQNNPFTKNATDTSLLHVTFLNAIPDTEKIKLLKSVDTKNDTFEIIEQAMYLLCQNGYGNTKLSNTFIENKLKVGATTRNWKTTNELLNMAKKLNNG